MEILLTGGLGYLGGRVSRHLAERSPYRLRLGTRQEVAAPAWLKQGGTVLLDMLDEASLETACRGVKCIVHLAAMNAIDSAKDPEQALLVNGLGSLKLLKAAVRAGVERIVYFSTAHVYGNPLTGVITEETLPFPKHPYAITHRIAEDFILAARDRGEIDGIVVRLSNGFGCPERLDANCWMLLATDLCKQAVTNGRLVLRSSGRQFRNFITLEDVGRAVHHLLQLSSESCGKGLFNLGGDHSILVIDLAHRIADRAKVMLGFRPEVRCMSPIPGEEPVPLYYSIDKLKDTGFSLLSNIDGEIDAILKFCQRAFGSQHSICR